MSKSDDRDENNIISIRTHNSYLDEDDINTLIPTPKYSFGDYDKDEMNITIPTHFVDVTIMYNLFHHSTWSPRAVDINHIDKISEFDEFQINKCVNSHVAPTCKYIQNIKHKCNETRIILNNISRPKSLLYSADSDEDYKHPHFIYVGITKPFSCDFDEDEMNITIPKYLISSVLNMAPETHNEEDNIGTDEFQINQCVNSPVAPTCKSILHIKSKYDMISKIY